MQHEIRRAIPLLNELGGLTEPGFARTPLPVYRRKDIKASSLRIKEWDYYCIRSGRIALGLTVADNGYLGIDAISLVDLTEKWEISKNIVSPLTVGRFGLPESPERGSVHRSRKKYSISFENDGSGKRVLTARMENFGPDGAIVAAIELFDEPAETGILCVPFEKQEQFCFRQRINCMRAKGQVRYGSKLYELDPSDSFAVLDWNRSVLPYRCAWTWVSASGLLDGVPFGINLGSGLGDTRAANDNMLFYNGKVHKLDRVQFHSPHDGQDSGSPWSFSSDDGRLEMRFVPSVDRAFSLNLRLIRSELRQSFGLFSGKAVLDDGTELCFTDFPGCAQKVDNKW